MQAKREAAAEPMYSSYFDDNLGNAQVLRKVYAATLVAERANKRMHIARDEDEQGFQFLDFSGGFKEEVQSVPTQCSRPLDIIRFEPVVSDGYVYGVHRKLITSAPSDNTSNADHCTDHLPGATGLGDLRSGQRNAVAHVVQLPVTTFASKAEADVNHFLNDALNHDWDTQYQQDRLADWMDINVPPSDDMDF